jgi:hypothetical protein
MARTGLAQMIHDAAGLAQHRFDGGQNPRNGQVVVRVFTERTLDGSGDGGGRRIEHRREGRRSVFVHGVREVGWLRVGGRDPSRGEEVNQLVEDVFKEVTLKSVGTEKLHFQNR